MELNKSIDNQTMTVQVEGWLDTETAPQLHELVEQMPEKITRLILDCTNMEYISSAGLRALLFAHKTMLEKDGFIIQHVNEDVKSVLCMSGFYERLNIE